MGQPWALKSLTPPCRLCPIPAFFYPPCPNLALPALPPDAPQLYRSSGVHRGCAQALSLPGSRQSSRGLIRPALFRITDEQLTKSIKEVRALTLQSFKVAVGRLLKQSPDLAVELIKTGEMIVAAEKSVHPAEVEALEYLKRRLAESIVGEA